MEKENKNAEWDFATVAPGANDEVIFAATYVTAGNYTYGTNTDSKITVATSVKTINIGFGYTKELDLQKSLTLTTAGSYLQSTAKISGVGAAPGDAKLILSGNATLNWGSGSLQHITVDIQSAATTRAALRIVNTAATEGPKIGATIINVHGDLNWTAQHVKTYTWPTEIHIHDKGAFNITAAGATFGHPLPNEAPNPALLKITNHNGGKLVLSSTGTATITGSYTSAGMTWLEKGTLAVTTVEQTGGTFDMRKDSIIDTPFLGIRDGSLKGSGKISGNLIFGHDPAKPGYALTTPLLSPGDTGFIGMIHVTHAFQMFNGHIAVDIAGATEENGQFQYDRIVIDGALRLTNTSANSMRLLTGTLLAAHRAIAANTEIPFLTYAEREGDFFVKAGEADLPVTLPGENWQFGRSEAVAPMRSWFKPTAAIAEVKGKVGGKAWVDNGAVAGVFESGVESGMSGVTVRLYDSTGMTIIATTTTAADGTYEFADVPAGTYVVEFLKPSGYRFAPSGQDSDADPLTGRVSVGVYSDVTGIDAGFGINTPPVAPDVSVTTTVNTPVSVFPPYFDPDGDALTIESFTQPAFGFVSLSSGGAGFMYMPPPGWTGTVTFTYTISDGNGGTATGTITITVA
jgi:hypothetical protein